MKYYLGMMTMSLSCMIPLIYTSFFLTDGLLMSAAVAASAITLFKACDFILALLCGPIVEKANFKLGKYNTSALDKLKLDLMYITNYSIITDIQIVFETVKILFLKESTEGFHSSGVLTEPVELREGSVGGE